MGQSRNIGLYPKHIFTDRLAILALLGDAVVDANEITYVAEVLAGFVNKKIFPTKSFSLTSVQADPIVTSEVLLKERINVVVRAKYGVLYPDNTDGAFATNHFAGRNLKAYCSKSIIEGSSLLISGVDAFLASPEARFRLIELSLR